MQIFKFKASIKRIFSLCCSYHNYTFRHLPTNVHNLGRVLVQTFSADLAIEIPTQ